MKLVKRLFSLAIGSDREWLHVVPRGAWKGHPVGPFAIGDREIGQILANFAAVGLEVPIDYEHQTDLAEANGKPAPAMGWIDRLEARPDGIWGHVRVWTQSGSAHLDAEEYRYVSPTLVFSTRDRVTGEKRGMSLQSVALTNIPFFTELSPVPNRASGDDTMNLALMLALLGLAATATEEDATTEIKSLKARAAVGDAVKAKFKWEQLPDDAVAQTESALDHKGYVPFAEHMSALGKLGAEAEVLSDEAFITKACASGRVTPAQKGAFRNMVKLDRATAEQWLAAAPVVVPVNPTDASRIPSAEGGASGALSAEEKALCSQLGITEEKFRAKRKGGN